MEIKDINKFEVKNNISVCVFAYEEGELFPRYISDHRNSRHDVDLLLIERGNKWHYCLIRNLGKLLHHTKGSSRRRCFISRFCMHGFCKPELLKEHITYSSKNAAQKIEMPEPHTIVKFEQFEKQFKIPFEVYCDMECFCVPNQNDHGKTMEYIPCSYEYQVVCVDSKFSKPPKIYTGPNASEKFIHALLSEENYIKNILNNRQPMNITAEEEIHFQEASFCHICKREFSDDDVKVRDHDHLTSLCRGAAHNLCNLEYKPPQFVPVIFRNLKHFDAKLICKAIGKFKNKKIQCIASTMENYISFSLGNFRFIDSYQFLNCSLELLVRNLAQEGDKHFPYLKHIFPYKWQTDLLLRKGVY